MAVTIMVRRSWTNKAPMLPMEAANQSATLPT